MGNDLADFLFRHAIVERPSEVTAQLLWPIARNECRHHDQAAVALAESRPLPDVTINNLIREFDHLRDSAANTLARGYRWVSHDDILRLGVKVLRCYRTAGQGPQKTTMSTSDVPPGWRVRGRLADGCSAGARDTPQGERHQHDQPHRCCVA